MPVSTQYTPKEWREPSWFLNSCESFYGNILNSLVWFDVKKIEIFHIFSMDDDLMKIYRFSR